MDSDGDGLLCLEAARKRRQPFKIGSAGKQFDELTDRDVITWNSMISGCIANGFNEKRIEVFIEMLGFGIEVRIHKAWGTNLGSPPDMCQSMAMVGLPASLGISSDTDASKLRTHLRDHFGVEVPLHYQAPKENEVEAENGDRDSLITGYAQISHPSLQHS
ncbi:hypothetical protein RJ639_012261 [Escallonia herrerae]|uniref:Uncharacterized protein n=1 Tax=Escallonia herrerae TaxID=1293975 RepID=A0AA88VR32_9ASTE|nr:hypothetical protein RJ639_012261 [Escallonia herrerae]